MTTLLNLDRESLDYFELNISAEDAGNPSLESYVLMPIIVGDINDNNPIFRSGINQTYWLYEVSPIIEQNGFCYNIFWSKRYAIR